ncbi:MAG TPA: NlpC/P60 family protein, partial [Actinomycetes bacterium]
RTSAAQWWAGAHVEVAALLPGDLVFYADNPADPNTIHHVGMYVGNGLMVHAPHTGDVVRFASVWREGYAGAVRVTGGAPGPVVPPPVTAPPPPPPPPMTTAPTTTTRAPTTTAPPTTAPPSSTTTTTSSPTTTTHRHRHRHRH